MFTFSSIPSPIAWHLCMVPTTILCTSMNSSGLPRDSDKIPPLCQGFRGVLHFLGKRVQRIDFQTSKHQVRCSSLTNTSLKRTAAKTSKGLSLAATRHLQACFQYSDRWYQTSLPQTHHSFGIKYWSLAESFCFLLLLPA